MAFGLFRNIPSFEGGNANTYVKTAYLMTGKYTETVWNGAGTGAGSILNLYDRVSTTYYVLTYNSNGTFKVQWEFDSIIEFKNIYVLAQLSGRTGHTFKLYTSLNGTDWTEQDSFASESGVNPKNLLATDIKARFIKVECTTGGGDMLGQIFTVEGVI